VKEKGEEEKGMGLPWNPADRHAMARTSELSMVMLSSVMNRRLKNIGKFSI
jgi:hypothetical protein